MKQSLQVLAALLFAFAAAPATAQLGPAAPVAERSGFPEGPPIAAVGHGTMFAPDGSIIKPTRAFTSFAVEYYLKQIKETSPYDLTTKMALIEKELASRTAKTPFDRTIHRSILLDWLIQEVRPENTDHISAINTTLRRSYFMDVLGLDPREYRLHYNSGIPLQYLKLLGDFGIVAYAITNAGGEKYVQECRDAGVPTPPTWKPENGPSDKNRGNWTFEGTQTLNFASSAPVSEVYAYDTAGVSSEPDGLCIALPRISGNTIGLLGIICLGRETGKACFWDRAGTGLNEEVPISGFKGGADSAARRTRRSGTSRLSKRPGRRTPVPPRSSTTFHSDPAKGIVAAVTSNSTPGACRRWVRFRNTARRCCRMPWCRPCRSAAPATPLTPSTSTH
jgi:hypothetical protein